MIQPARDTSADPWATPERIALRQLVRSFVGREVVPYLAEWESAGELPRELHRKAAEVGLLGIGFPEDAGGSGGNAIDSAIVTEEILAGGGSSGVGASLFTHGIAIPHIVRDGSPELVERYARQIMQQFQPGRPARSRPSRSHLPGDRPGPDPVARRAESGQAVDAG
ncbi:MAG: acyl-CoA dehydrogenase family protein, partial [Actinomycetota bacterium]|nr:acyl-CoA dehydrogenase family protein [Actinomycetota bacterium]